MANAATFVSSPRLEVVQVANADGTNFKSLLTAGANGTKVTGLIASSTDSSNRVLQLSLLRSATNYVLTTQTVLANAGTDGLTAAANLLGTFITLPVDNDGQEYLFLKSGDVLQVNTTTTVTAAKLLSVFAICGDF